MMYAAVRFTCLAWIVAAMGMLGSSAFAGQDCARCGCGANVQKVCRPVCTTERVKVAYWDYVCEDVCVPISRCKKGAVNECGEGACESKMPGSNSYRTKTRTCKRLVRKTCYKEVPVVRWVTEYTCDDCGKSSKPDAAPPRPSRSPPSAETPRPAPPLPLIVKPGIWVTG